MIEKELFLKKYVESCGDEAFIAFRSIFKGLKKEEVIWLWNYECLDEYKQIIIRWECIFRFPDNELLFALIQQIRNTKTMEWNEKLFLLNQIADIMFVDSQCNTIENKDEMFRLYRDISEQFQSMFTYVKLTERNEKIILITIEQLLSVKHAPTEMLFERAKILKKNGYEVIIVNTSEYKGGKLPDFLFSCKLPLNHLKKQCNSIEYNGEVFSLIQFANMPNLEATKLLLEFISSVKPFFIVNIGGDSLVLDVCKNIVPVMNINTVNDISRTMAQIQVTGNRNKEYCKHCLSILGLKEENYKEFSFQYSLPIAKNTIITNDLNFPQNQMIIVVVGNRLSYEITDEFVEMISRILEKGGFLVLVGLMENYDYYCGINEVFKEKSMYLGYRDDLLEIYKQCDIYVNPQRVGGGTSAAYALYEGLPAISVDYGDVGTLVGKEFCVKDYSEMQKELVRYMTDKKYYMRKSQIARIKARELFDIDTSFMNIINEFIMEKCVF